MMISKRNTILAGLWMTATSVSSSWAFFIGPPASFAVTRSANTKLSMAPEGDEEGVVLNKWSRYVFGPCEDGMVLQLLVTDFFYHG